MQRLTARALLKSVDAELKVVEMNMMMVQLIDYSRIEMGYFENVLRDCSITYLLACYALRFPS
jgi:hypothetical protein